jgi:hypothetical protein
MSILASLDRLKPTFNRRKLHPKFYNMGSAAGKKNQLIKNI